MAILEMSNPAYPNRIGYLVLPDIVRDIYVLGEVAYVATGTGGIWLVDVSNPAKPVAVSRYDTPGFASGLAAGEGFVYVADGESNFRVANILNPTTTTKVGFYIIPADAQKVAVAGDLAYVIDTHARDPAGTLIPGSLQVLDTSNPKTPTAIGSYSLPVNLEGGNFMGIAVEEGYLYMATGFSGLFIFQAR